MEGKDGKGKKKGKKGREKGEKRKKREKKGEKKEKRKRVEKGSKKIVTPATHLTFTKGKRIQLKKFLGEKKSNFSKNILP